MKSQTIKGAKHRARRSPCGERGLKSKAGLTLKDVRSRSPCGERGLKYWKFLI